MSTEDSHPAQTDKARQVYPVMFFGDDSNGSPVTDFRPIVMPADAVEEKPGPKEKSAPEPAGSSVQTVETAKTETKSEPPAKTVEKPAAKVNGPTKATSLGTPASSSPKTTGN